jgi:hypothetical protein
MSRELHAPAELAEDETLFSRLAENDGESATVALLVDLCRRSPALRHWLWEEFGKDEAVRRRFATLVHGAAPAYRRFAELTGDDRARRAELRRLRTEQTARIYGGLTRSEVVCLARRYQAGTVDPGVFLLAHEWRAEGEATPLLMWAGLQFLTRIIPRGRRRLLRHLSRALAVLHRYEDEAVRRASIGYVDWWKLQALLYILQFPQPAYRVRDLRAHLARLGLAVDSLAVRRFCTRHRIRRDERPGRPRRRPGADSRA